MAKIEDRYLLHALAYEPLLRACLQRYTKNESDTAELLQETYARLLVAGADPEAQVRSMRAFALKVARNVALDWLRRRQIVPIELVADMEALDVMDEAAQIEEIVNTDQELGILAAAVGELPTVCRRVFTLRKVYGYSQDEIAERLGISVSTVNNHLTKAARRCADVLFSRQPPGTGASASFSALRRALFRRKERSQ